MRISKIVTFLALVAVVFGASDAEARARRHTYHHRSYSIVDRSAAYADIVIDSETGQIIHEEDSDSLRHPASLTKMMTLYLTFQALDSGRLDLDRYLRVSSDAAYQAPSKLGLRVGQRIRVEDAILGLVTESANDAAVVLAEGLAGSESAFADMMTRQAHALGMTRTRFRNASGLPDPYQITTARDMAVLGAALINHYPEYYPYFSREGFRYAGGYHRNHNRLMDRYDGMDGIKTGYIRASGFNLVSSVKRGGTRLVAVVFGGRSATRRDNQMARLLDQSFADIRNDSRLQRIASAKGEGDSDDNVNNDNEDVELPAKRVASSASKGVQKADYKPSREKQKRAERTVSSRTPAGGGTWGVQIGAYSNPEAGHQVLDTLVSSITGLSYTPKPQVQKVKAGGGAVMYRARLMALDQRSAEKICAYLNRNGKSCLTVEP
ncbi:MAG: D-alanyl-D-alanine carboxypeptidase family protein [Bdellovibrionales bacterium]